MTRFIPAWQRRKMDEEKAKRDAPPLNAHAAGLIIAALGELKPDQQGAYLDLLVEQGRLTPVQRAYVAKVASGALL